MIFLIEVNNEVDHLLSEIKIAVNALINELKPTKSAISIAAGTDLLAEGKFADGFYLIADGAIRLEAEDRALVICEPGDVIGAECYKHPSAFAFSHRADFGLVADLFSWEDFFASLNGNPKLIGIWTGYLSLQVKLYQCLVASLSQTETPFVPDFLSFEPGEVIIAEGTESDGVYTMVSGSAEVSVRGVKVGEVLADEIFGAIAAFTAGLRTATVLAIEPCSVIKVETSQFEKLLRARPDTVDKLVRDLARAVVSSNEKLLQSKG